jgi:threonine dehydrogenase-like Zn-dependent dehydrogenase
VIAVDRLEARLDVARQHGAETINFEKEDPVEAIKELTGQIGVDRLIDAVGVDAMRPERGPAAKDANKNKEKFEQELEAVAPETNPQGDLWTPGDAPSQALRWAVEALAKAGTLSVIGVYPPQAEAFPIGAAMNKNLTLNMGNCNHRRYVPTLVRLVRSGAVDPTTVLSKQVPIISAIDAYESFDRRQSGWMKVELEPSA